MLLIAGGVGIAPLVFLADTALEQKRSVTMILGAATAAQVYPTKLLPHQIKLAIFTEDGSGIGTERKGVVTDGIPEFVEQVDQIFACGPAGMYRSMISLLREVKDKKSIQVSLEVRMGCGVGACFGCSIRTRDGVKQVCKDGPVFELSRITLDEIRI